jgi:hypothetical protein
MAGGLFTMANYKDVSGGNQVCNVHSHMRYTHITYSVYDADGEFLLIEAADELPSWVKPENVEHRVSRLR